MSLISIPKQAIWKPSWSCSSNYFPNCSCVVICNHTYTNKQANPHSCVCNYSYTFFFFFLHNVNQGVRRTSKPVCWKIFSFPSYGLTNSRFPNSTFFNPSHHKNPKYLIFKLLNLFSIQESLHLFTTTYKITMLDLTNRIVKDKMKIYLWSSKAFLP